jgi:hypothetical protein
LKLLLLLSIFLLYDLLEKFYWDFLHDCSTKIRRYVDTPPPARANNARTTLRNEVPKPQVGYVQEAFQSMNVFITFDERDADYYQLKSILEPRPSVTKILGDVNSAITKRFTVWWDKYKLTLEESSPQMKYFLKS